MSETTIGVVIPLAEELRAFIDSFSGDEFASTDETRGTRVFYIRSRMGQVRVVVTQQEAMGNGPAQEATTALISHYSPDLIVGIGICGAIHKDLRIGDVVVVNAVFDVIDAAKAEEPTEPNVEQKPAAIGFDLKLMSRPQVPTPLMVNRTSQLEAWSPDAFKKWQDGCVARRADSGLYPGPPIIRKDVTGAAQEEPWSNEKPQLIVGASASGFVMEALAFLRVHAFNRELRIVETECAGVARACRGEHLLTPFLFLRVVTDYADTNSRSARSEEDHGPLPKGTPEETARQAAMRAEKTGRNHERRRWATRNPMDLFRALVLEERFVSSVRSAIERSWDVSVLMSRFKESRELFFPRERTLALAQLFTLLVNQAPTTDDVEHQCLCISAETLILTRLNWEYAQLDEEKITEVRILRMSPSTVKALSEFGGIKDDTTDQFERNLQDLRKRFSTVPFRVGDWIKLSPFHGTFHGDVFWIGHWEVDESAHILTSSTPFVLYNGANAVVKAAHYRTLFNEPFQNPTFGKRYSPYGKLDLDLRNI